VCCMYSKPTRESTAAETDAVAINTATLTAATNAVIVAIAAVAITVIGCPTVPYPAVSARSCSSSVSQKRSGGKAKTTGEGFKGETTGVADNGGGYASPASQPASYRSTPIATEEAEEGTSRRHGLRGRWKLQELLPFLSSSTMSPLRPPAPRLPLP